MTPTLKLHGIDPRETVASALARGAVKLVPAQPQSRWYHAQKMTPAVAMARRRAELAGKDLSGFPPRIRRRNGMGPL